MEELTDAEYWSDIWRNSSLPAAIDPRTDPTSGEFCGFIEQALKGRGGSLLEIGCGCSRWLPYFSTLGFRVAGIDYSAEGCRQAQMILDRERIAGDILECNAFAPNPGLVGKFDVVASLGVVEHFRDTEATVRAFSRYLKPQGLIISTCPNMAGLLGLAQRLLNRPVYDRHVPLTADDLRKAHENAGLTVRDCAYIGSLDFHVVNLHEAARFDKRQMHRVLMRLSRIGWKLPVRAKRGRLFSSFVACAAQAV
jgi:2-polyprenyl-3-methyl-5-hydroxy-6-metoxy-1,4-benzoquinol methylase